MPAVTLISHYKLTDLEARLPTDLVVDVDYTLVDSLLLSLNSL